VTTVLLKQRDLFTKRWRDVSALDPGEVALQITLVARLRHELAEHVLWFHVPNGEFRDARSAAKLKAMGVLPGVVDLVFDDGRQVLYLELKSARGRLSPVQQAFKARVEVVGRTYAVAHSVDEALTILRAHGMHGEPPV
jgi:hypothetical protein